jgi:predicted ATPase
MDRVFFEGIRCFATRQEVPLAPLTVLVGENSSGKSTALALIRLAWDLVRDEKEVLDFNEEPFLLGAFDQIVSSFKDKEARSFFSVGCSIGTGQFTAHFVPFHGQPAMEIRVCEGPLYRLLYGYELETGAYYLDIENSSGGEEVENWRVAESYEYELIKSLGARPLSFAPIRTRPQRTYDPIKGAVNSEGAHVPLVLASSALRKAADWQQLVKSLELFGRQSGLFARVDVRRLGESESDPFQVQVYIGGEAVNLIDVGYGVSQILPIVVDCLRGESGGTYLLQQPEVHLHPRAQAELGSFLGVLAKQQNKRFVVETHSDYLVDRIRMDIRDKKGITPEDVALLYFERKNGEATIHRLELDDQGNILNAPPGYRRFFLEEERRFLGG